MRLKRYAPAYREPAPDHEWTALQETHAARGIAIDANTAATRWRGERMGYELGVWVLCNQVARAQRAQAPRAVATHAHAEGASAEGWGADSADAEGAGAEDAGAEEASGDGARAGRTRYAAFAPHPGVSAETPLE